MVANMADALRLILPETQNTDRFHYGASVSFWKQPQVLQTSN